MAHLVGFVDGWEILTPTELRDCLAEITKYFEKPLHRDASTPRCPHCAEDVLSLLGMLREDHELASDLHTPKYLDVKEHLVAAEVAASIASITWWDDIVETTGVQAQSATEKIFRMLTRRWETSSSDVDRLLVIRVAEDLARFYPYAEESVTVFSDLVALTLQARASLTEPDLRREVREVVSRLVALWTRALKNSNDKSKAHARDTIGYRSPWIARFLRVFKAQQLHPEVVGEWQALLETILAEGYKDESNRLRDADREHALWYEQADTPEEQATLWWLRTFRVHLGDTNERDFKRLIAVSPADWLLHQGGNSAQSARTVDISGNDGRFVKVAWVGDVMIFREKERIRVTAAFLSGSGESSDEVATENATIFRLCVKGDRLTKGELGVVLQLDETWFASAPAYRYWVSQQREKHEPRRKPGTDKELH